MAPYSEVFTLANMKQNAISLLFDNETLKRMTNSSKTDGYAKINKVIASSLSDITSPFRLGGNTNHSTLEKFKLGMVPRKGR
jgi:hypothetical protein